MKRITTLPALLVIITILLSPAGAAAGTPASPGAVPALAPVGAGFTYHGQLTKAGNPVNAVCNFRFGLWDALEDGSRIGEVQVVGDVAVTNGLFTVLLNAGGHFGPNAFNGDARWLEIEVQCEGDPGFTLLKPRQPLTSTPYAVYAQIIPSPYGRQVNFTNPANIFHGDGGGLTGLNAGGLATGIVPSDVVSGTYGNPLDFSNPANDFAGDGAGLTGLNASNLVSGTVPGGRLGGTYTNAISLTNVSNIFAGSGAGLTNLDASNLISGTLISGVLAGEYSNALTLSNASNVLAGDGAGLANVDADTLDGLDSTAFQGQGFLRTVRVSPVPGDPVASGTALLNALAGITGNSASNPYLLKIEPGIYDLGNSALTMKPYVDVEGSGELVTTITAVGSGAANTGTIVGANDAELRFLTVENTGLSNYAIAIYNSSASPRLTHVTASGNQAGSTYGIYNVDSAAPVMTSVTASGSDGGFNHGIYNNNSSPSMTDVTASASSTSGLPDNFGISNENGSSPVMTNVTASASGPGDNFGVANANSSPAMTQVSASAAGGEIGYGVYNFNSTPIMTDVAASASASGFAYGVANFNSSSPIMTDVAASASALSFACGVCNAASSPAMTDVTASASGISTAGNYYGVRNVDASSPTMTEVTASATGGGINYGVYNDASSPTLQTSVLIATGGQDNYGLYNTGGGGTVFIDISSITSDGTTIRSAAGITTRVGASQLAGSAIDTSAGGTVTCIGVYDEAYASPGYTVCP